MLEAKAVVDPAFPTLPSPLVSALQSLAEPWDWLPLPKALGRISHAQTEDFWEKGGWEMEDVAYLLF